MPSLHLNQKNSRAALQIDFDALNDSHRISNPERGVLVRRPVGVSFRFRDAETGRSKKTRTRRLPMPAPRFKLIGVDTSTRTVEHSINGCWEERKNCDDGREYNYGMLVYPDWPVWSVMIAFCIVWSVRFHQPNRCAFETILIKTVKNFQLFRV